MRDDFVIFILTHGRANNMHTYQALQRAGYTGKIIFLLDNEDTTIAEYRNKFGENNIYIFDKLQVSKWVDSMDLSLDRRAILYARCVSYQVAKNLGYKYFLQLDDD